MATCTSFYYGKLEKRVLQTGPGHTSWLDRALSLQHKQEVTPVFTIPKGDMLWGIVASAHGRWVGGCFCHKRADDATSWAEVLSEPAWTLLTQERVSPDTLKYPASHGPTENSGHLGGQWAGLLTRPDYLSETWPKVTEENFVCVSSISSE